ncbi:MAG: hypothetical protein JRM83_01670 [Nitrososphaerota archaeon]|nr:hypothetical protein [Nitrososphaerota archaeon]
MARKRLTLEWDHAEPLWEGGVNLPLNEPNGPGVRKDIRNWYRKFSRAEEVIEVGNRSHPRAEVKEALVELKHLIPEGTKLTAEIYATLEVDHGLGVEELEPHVFGKSNGAIKAWRKS